MSFIKKIQDLHNIEDIHELQLKEKNYLTTNENLDTYLNSEANEPDFDTIIMNEDKKARDSKGSISSMVNKNKNLLKRNSKQILLEQQFSLPNNFEQKIKELEEKLQTKNISANSLKDLIHLYTVITHRYYILNLFFKYRIVLGSMKLLEDMNYRLVILKRFKTYII